MNQFCRNNALSIVFIILFVATFAGQLFTGFHHFNDTLLDDHLPAVTFMDYLSTGHFFESTFENWESEFLQMGLFVVLTIWFKQKGSSESKSFDEKEEVDRQPMPGPDAPWPVKKGGLALALYRHSLSIALFALFIASFILHFYGSHKDENFELAKKGLPPTPAGEYIFSARFWFESFQNWQSEFLSVFAIVFLSIYLRQDGSPQSKPVDAPNSETGE